MAEDRKGEGTGRRGALKLLVSTGSAAFACALAGPAAVFVTAPANGGAAGGQRWIKTVRLDALVEAEPKKVAIVADQRDAWTITKDVELGAVWLVRHGDTVLALSAICPHLGCSVDVRQGDGKGFGCPCHTSAFDPAGHRTGGPAPRDMDMLETRLDAGFVLVDFRKFRMSVPEKIEVG